MTYVAELHKEREAAIQRTLVAARARIAELEAALQSVTAYANDPARMTAWDVWRAAIARGDRGSWPRDGFEALLEHFNEIASDALRARSTP